MNKSIIRKILVATSLLVLGTASVAKANEGVYLSGSAGASILGKHTDSETTGKAKFKAGPAAHVALGYQMDEWRAELEGGFFSNKQKITAATKHNKRTFTAMANLYYDVAICESMNWYLGAGLGLANVKYKNLDDAKKSRYAFAYQAMTGVSYNVSEQVAINLGYRAFKHAKTKHESKTFAPGTKYKIKPSFSHSVEAGVRYTF